MNRRYNLRILVHSGTTQYWIEEIIENVTSFMSSESFYHFRTGEAENERDHYYPVANTIINEI
jgi:hypothetical protein